jgi:O-antigen ligase
MRDRKVRPEFSKALWLPILWLLVLGSRPASFWLGVGGGSSSLEGNFFDASLYLCQMFLALFILAKRGFQWGHLFQRNIPLVLFYGFMFLTILWSPFPFSTFKRWFKDLGAVFTILIIFTEGNPMEALKAVFARCAYVLLPLSVVCLKFFPEIGRSFSHSSVMFTGVTVHKNSLGEIALVFGLFLLAEFLQPNRPHNAKWYQGHRLTVGLTLATAVYLLIVCQSRGAQVCFAIGAFVVVGYKLPLLKGRHAAIAAIFLIGGPLYFLADSIFHISDYLLTLIGKDPTLTDRVYLWQAIKENPVNPIVGGGYMMYWDMHKDLAIGGPGAETDGWRSAHNGYLETYLDGGALGVFFLTILLLAFTWRAVREMMNGSQYGRLAFGLLVAMVVYNFTEAVYGRRAPLWFTFLLLSLEFRSGTYESPDTRLDDFTPDPVIS